MVAKEFGVLPTQALEDLWDDPARFSLGCVELLEYGRAWAVFDGKKKKAIDAYPNKRMMERVEDVAHEIAAGAIEASATPAATDGQDGAAPGESSSPLASVTPEG